MPKNSFWISPSLDQRDIYFDPSKGYFLSQHFGFYGILKQEQEHYIRSDSKAEYFLTLFNIPVTDKWNFKAVFGVHTGLSFIMKQPGWEGKGAYILDSNKLAIDGMFIGRGWSREYRNKGHALWENWAEIRFPIVPGIIAWDFFFDAAGVEPAGSQGTYFRDFTLDCMRFSFGGGIRFTLPQFPFRFSFAKRFRYIDGQFTWERGDIPFGDPNDPGSGIDPVISFAISY
jgi:outer membrane protein insertion porin family